MPNKDTAYMTTRTNDAGDRIKAVEEVAIVLGGADKKRLRIALDNVPSIAVDRRVRTGAENGPGGQVTFEQIALQILDLGFALGESMRDHDETKAELAALKAERATVRAYFGVTG